MNCFCCGKPLKAEYDSDWHKACIKRFFGTAHIPEIEIDEKTVIMLDQTMYIRTIENLFSNALRYTKENDTITFTATESEQDISISMEDTGMGISEKDKNHIFELLYRGTNSRREEGFGIGLSVVKSIADTHGWTIDVESKLNVGTKFTIRIRKSQ